MQSGKARTDRWVVEFEPAEAKRPDPLTGWAGSGDTREQVLMNFASLEAAKAYAEREGLHFKIGRTSGRERVRLYVWISGGAVSLKKKSKKNPHKLHIPNT